MRDSVEALFDWRTDKARLKSSYRRLADSRLPVNLYSARAHQQRQAAMLLHGIADGTGSWEELDCRQLADDARGDRTSLLLGGTACGVALDMQESKGLLTIADTGTLFLTHVERLPPAAQYVLLRIIEAGRYTPVGDPYPRPLSCRIIVATHRPLAALARSLLLETGLSDALGQISLRAENVIRALTSEDFLTNHPSRFAAAS
jgi:transcriptional regulator of acetoin/glycerol metabolism